MIRKEEILEMIQKGKLIPAQEWDLYILGNGKDRMINHGLQVYIQSFHTDEFEIYTLREHHETHGWGKLISRLIPWLKESKIWIECTEREVTITNSPDYIKEKKKQTKINKTGSYEGPLIQSII